MRKVLKHSFFFFFLSIHLKSMDTLFVEIFLFFSFSRRKIVNLLDICFKFYYLKTGIKKKKKK